ncbi:MAG TPA: biopolymer transporter ExbD [Candidatus Limnocylindrales bacterium]|nr:biopolymer transporter ExbD [Candidatus Limnocylindrales bacterium]
MKFPRNARLLRSTLDVAPFAVVFFLLIMFLTLAALLPTPGLSLRLPVASDLPGTDKPTVAVAIDPNGRLFFANQIVTENELKSHLYAAMKDAHEPLTLIVQADQAVTYGQLVHLTMLARDAGIHDVLLATLPRVVNEPVQP